MTVRYRENFYCTDEIYPGVTYTVLLGKRWYFIFIVEFVQQEFVLLIVICNGFFKEVSVIKGVPFYYLTTVSDYDLFTGKI